MSLSTLKYCDYNYIAEWKSPKSRVAGKYAKETPRLIVPMAKYDKKTRAYIKEKRRKNIRSILWDQFADRKKCFTMTKRLKRCKCTVKWRRDWCICWKEKRY